MTREQEIKILEALASITSGIINEFIKVNSQLAAIEKRLSLMEQRLANVEPFEVL